MKKIIPFILILTLSACIGSNTPTVKHIQQEAGICEETIAADSVVFTTNVTLKNEPNKRVLLFKCAAIETGTASVFYGCHAISGRFF